MIRLKIRRQAISGINFFYFFEKEEDLVRLFAIFLAGVKSGDFVKISSEYRPSRTIKTGNVSRRSPRLLAFSFFPLTRYPSFLDLHRQCALPVTNPRGSLRYKTEMPTDRRWLLKKSGGSEQIPRIGGTMEAVRKQYRKLFYAGPTRGGCR